MKKNTLLNFILEIKIEIEKLRLTNSKLASDALILLNNIIYEKKDCKSLEEIVSLISQKINAEYLIGFNSNELNNKVDSINPEKDNEITEFFINELYKIKNKIITNNSNDLTNELNEIENYFYQRIDSFNLINKVKIYEIISDVKFLLLLNKIENNNELIELTEDNYIQILYGMYFSKIENNTIKEKIDRMKFYKPITNYEKLNEFLNELVDKKIEIKEQNVQKNNVNTKRLKRKYGSYDSPKIVIESPNSYYGPYRTIASYINERNEYVKFYIFGDQTNNTVKEFLYISKLEIDELLMRIFRSNLLRHTKDKFSFIIEIKENIENIKNDIKSGILSDAKVVSLCDESTGCENDKIVMNYFKNRESFSISNPYSKIIFENIRNVIKIKSVSYKFVDFLNKKVQISIVIEKENGSSKVLTYIDGRLVDEYNVFNDNISIEEILFLKNFDISKYSDSKCLNPIIFLNNSVEDSLMSDIPIELQQRIIKEDNTLYDKYIKESFTRQNNNIILKTHDGTTMKVIISSYSSCPITIHGYYINTREVSKEDFFTYRFSYLDLLKGNEDSYEKEKLEKARNLVRRLNNKKTEN